MAKYKYSLVKESISIYEFDNEEPPQSGKKILEVVGRDFKTAAFVVRALNARFKWESRLEQSNVKQGDANTASPK